MCYITESAIDYISSQDAKKKKKCERCGEMVEELTLAEYSNTSELDEWNGDESKDEPETFHKEICNDCLTDKKIIVE